MANIFSCACGRRVLITGALPRVGEEQFCSGNCCLLGVARARRAKTLASSSVREVVEEVRLCAAVRGAKKVSDGQGAARCAARKAAKAEADRRLRNEMRGASGASASKFGGGSSRKAKQAHRERNRREA